MWRGCFVTPQGFLAGSRLPVVILQRVGKNTAALKWLTFTLKNSISGISFIYFLQNSAYHYRQFVNLVYLIHQAKILAVFTVNKVTFHLLLFSTIFAKSRQEFSKISFMTLFFFKVTVRSRQRNLENNLKKAFVLRQNNGLWPSSMTLRLLFILRIFLWHDYLLCVKKDFNWCYLLSIFQFSDNI